MILTWVHAGGSYVTLLVIITTNGVIWFWLYQCIKGSVGFSLIRPRGWQIEPEGDELRTCCLCLARFSLGMFIFKPEEAGFTRFSLACPTVALKERNFQLWFTLKDLPGCFNALNKIQHGVVTHQQNCWTLIVVVNLIQVGFWVQF